MSPEKNPNRYDKIIEKIFLKHYKRGMLAVPFSREEITQTAKELGIVLPKNLGDLIYTFRFRADLPKSILSKAPEGKSWTIKLVGQARYCFAAVRLTVIEPRSDLAATKIPDATPGLIEKYALSDEQALLAKVRYNRLVDIFTGVACYPLQSHLRTTVKNFGQVETDEVYIGVDRRGAHYVFPVQAKGGRDKQSIVQVEQDFAMCGEKFQALICRPIAAQFMQSETIALFEFEEEDGQIVVASEKHYRLVPQENVTPEDLAAYRHRPIAD